MPRKDGTGPMGMGSGTGWGMGPCKGNAGNAGFGMGCGRSRGRGNRMAMLSANPPVQENTILENQIKMLETRLNQMKEQLHKTEV